MKILAVVLVSFAMLSMAEAGPLDRLDRIEDRMDRRESYVDRQTDTGRWDRIEDVLDRRESVRDRRGLDTPGWIDRHERRSWWRLWGDRQPS